MNKTILAIETSCDDTSASIISDGKIESNIISSQLDHKKLGGVVPEIASRSHQKNIIYIVDSALSDAGVVKSDSYHLSRLDIATKFNRSTHSNYSEQLLV